MFGRQKSRFNIYTWFALGIGALSGAAVALLFAPKTGRQLQKQLREAIEEGVENVQSAVKRAVA